MLPRKASDNPRRPGLLCDDEGGNAALEFIVVGTLMLVPLAYLIITLASIQGQALGVATAVRHLSRSIAVASDDATADVHADRVLESVTSQYGIAPGTVTTSIDCIPSGAQCPRAGAIVSVTVRAEVALPMTPSLFGLDRIARVPVQATAVQRVSRFWEDR